MEHSRLVTTGFGLNGEKIKFTSHSQTSHKEQAVNVIDTWQLMYDKFKALKKQGVHEDPTGLETGAEPKSLKSSFENNIRASIGSNSAEKNSKKSSIDTIQLNAVRTPLKRQETSFDNPTESEIGLADTDLQIIDSMYWEDSVDDMKDHVKEWYDIEEKNTPLASSSSIPGLEVKVETEPRTQSADSPQTSFEIKEQMNTPEIASRLLSKTALRPDDSLNTSVLKSQASKHSVGYNLHRSNSSALMSIMMDEDSHITNLYQSQRNIAGHNLTSPTTTEGFNKYKLEFQLHSDAIPSGDPAASTPKFFLTSPNFDAEPYKRQKRESLLMDFSPTAKFSKTKLNKNGQNIDFMQNLLNVNTNDDTSNITDASLNLNLISSANISTNTGTNKSTNTTQPLLSSNLDSLGFMLSDIKSLTPKNSQSSESTSKMDGAVSDITKALISIEKSDPKDKIPENIAPIQDNSIFQGPISKSNDHQSSQNDLVINKIQDINGKMDSDINIELSINANGQFGTNQNSLSSHSILSNDKTGFSAGKDNSSFQGSTLAGRDRKGTNSIDNRDFDTQSNNVMDLNNGFSSSGNAYKGSNNNLKSKEIDNFILENDIENGFLLDDEVKRKMKEEDDMFEALLSRAKKTAIKEFKTPFKKPPQTDLNRGFTEVSYDIPKQNTLFNNFQHNFNSLESSFEETLKKSKIDPVTTFKTPFKTTVATTNSTNVAILPHPKNTELLPNNQDSTLSSDKTSSKLDSSFKKGLVTPRISKMLPSLDTANDMDDMAELEVDLLLSKYGSLTKASLATSTGLLNPGSTIKSTRETSESNKTLPLGKSKLSNQHRETLYETPTKTHLTKPQISSGLNESSRNGVGDSLSVQSTTNMVLNVSGRTPVTLQKPSDESYASLDANGNSYKTSSIHVNQTQSKKSDINLNASNNLNNLVPTKNNIISDASTTLSILKTPNNIHKLKKTENVFDSSTTFDRTAPLNSFKPPFKQDFSSLSNINLNHTPTSQSSKLPQRKLVHSQGLRRPNSARGSKSTLFKSPVPISKHKKLFKSPAMLSNSRMHPGFNTPTQLKTQEKAESLPQNFLEIKSKKIDLNQFASWAKQQNIQSQIESSQQVKSITFESAKSFRFTIGSNKNEHSKDIEQWGAKEALAQLKESSIDTKASTLSEPELEYWVSNHYQQIVWYLAAMSRRFPNFEPHFWSRQAVFERLVSRFKKEFLQVSRSSIRKILEKDSSSKSLVVLCVTSVLSPMAILLTDGWYTIRGQIDSVLSSAIERGRLVVGAKVVISGAQLITGSGGNDGISPWQILDPASDTSPTLVINSNSVRTCAWYRKLGFQSKHFRMSYSVHTLNPNGGPAYGELDVVICRRYPIRYLESLPNNTRITRSSAEESRVSAEHSNKERICAQKLYQKIENSNSRKATIQIQNIKLASLEDKSGEELYEIYSNCNDQPGFYSVISQEMRNSLQDHISLSKLETNETIKNELLDMVPPRKVSSLFQVLVDDFRTSSKANTRKKYSRIGLSLWNADASVWDQFAEGSRFKIYGAIPSGYKSFQKNASATNAGHQQTFLRLNLTRNSRWVPVAKNTNNMEIPDSYHPRQTFTVSQLSQKLLYTDVDIFASVVSCQPSNHFGQEVTMLALSTPDSEYIEKFGPAINLVNANSSTHRIHKENSDYQASGNTSYTNPADLMDLSGLSELYNTQKSDKGLKVYEKMPSMNYSNLKTEKIKSRVYFSTNIFGNLKLKEGSIVYIKDIYLNFFGSSNSLYTAISRDYTDLVILHTPTLSKINSF